VSVLGREANWVRNLEADGARAELRHGRREAVTLVEVQPVAERYPVFRIAPRSEPARRSSADAA
jgi:hypothetical protein